MDIGLIIAIVGSTFAIIGVVISMMFWARSEANTLRAEAKEDRKDFMQISRNMENVIVCIEKEIRDFHCRLLEIEMGRK